MLLALLATGHPAIPTGEIDFTPLLYMAVLLLGIRRARFPFRLWMVPAALFAGGLIDSVSDGMHLSTTTTLCVLVLLALFVPRFSTPACSHGRPAV